MAVVLPLHVLFDGLSVFTEKRKFFLSVHLPALNQPAPFLTVVSHSPLLMMGKCLASASVIGATAKIQRLGMVSCE